MNNSVVLDSSAIISLSFCDDSNHDLALQISHALAGNNSSLILPGEIITEVLNVVGKRIGRDRQLEIGKDLLESEEFITIETDEEIRNSAFILLQKVANSVSYTDCIVMAVADYFNTKTIFGFDHAFMTNGYLLAK